MLANGDLVPAVILHRRPYSETSFILEVLTQHEGRIGLMARGERKRSARGQGATQLFQPLRLSWRGRGELPTMSACEPAGAAFTLHGKQLISGLYVNELLVRLLQRGDPHVELWPIYLVTLQRLEQADNCEAALRVFEKRLLAAIGYGLELRLEAYSERPVNNDITYRYNPEAGPVAALGRGTVHGDTLAALDAEELTDVRQLREAKLLMRELLNTRLDGRPLNSRRLIRS